MSNFDQDKYDALKRYMRSGNVDPDIQKLAEEVTGRAFEARKRIQAVTTQMLRDESFRVPEVVYGLFLDAVIAMMALNFGNRAKTRDSLSVLLDEILDVIDSHMDKHNLRGMLSTAERMAANGDIEGARKIVREASAKIGD